MREIISIDLYFRDFVTKKDRRIEYKDQFNNDILTNAKKLLVNVNKLLNDLGISKGDVTSGWRPPTVNAQTTNAAKKSLHMLGLAVDILDNKTQDLGKLIASRPDLLKRYNLWLENPDHTRGKNTNWVHLDVGSRSDRPTRMFNP